MRIYELYAGVSNKPMATLSSALKTWNPGSSVLALIANAGTTANGALGGMILTLDTSVTTGVSTPIPATYSATSITAEAYNASRYLGIKVDDYRHSLDLNNDNVALGEGSFIMSGDNIIGVYHYWTGNGASGDDAKFTYTTGTRLTAYNGFLCPMANYTGGGSITTGAPAGDLTGKQPIAEVLGTLTPDGGTVPALVIKML